MDLGQAQDCLHSKLQDIDCIEPINTKHCESFCEGTGCSKMKDCQLYISAKSGKKRGVSSNNPNTTNDTSRKIRKGWW